VTTGLSRRRSGARALLALLALVAVVWLNVAPHHHLDDGSERRCPACQLQRGDGTAAPPERPAALGEPPTVAVARIVDVSPASFDPAFRGAPPPGRSPPASFS
jgi:hypothetical protein